MCEQSRLHLFHFATKKLISLKAFRLLMGLDFQNMHGRANTCATLLCTLTNFTRKADVQYSRISRLAASTFSLDVPATGWFFSSRMRPGSRASWYLMCSSRMCCRSVSQKMHVYRIWGKHEWSKNSSRAMEIKETQKLKERVLFWNSRIISVVVLVCDENYSQHSTCAVQDSP